MAHLELRYPTSIYSAESILLAAQELQDFATMHLSIDADQFVVGLSIDDQKIVEDEFLHRFEQGVNDAALRIVIGARTDAIRQMIVAQAFAPCDNLGQIIDAFEHHGR